MKKYLIMAAACLCFLCACDTPTGTPLKPVIIDEETLEKPESQETEPTQEQQQEQLPTGNVISDEPAHEGMVRSKLTNMWVEPEVANTRPIAVMTPNEASAIPHYNLSNASIIYEAPVEGRMTRMIALYEGWWNYDKIGNVRSLRTYYAYWAMEYDAFIVHFGGPFYINSIVEAETTQNIDGNQGTHGDSFFRSTDRKAPHNAYLDGTKLYQAIQNKGYSLESRGMEDENHFQFATVSEPNTLEQYETGARNATYIDMTGAYPLTRCYFRYNEEDGLYYRFQHLSGASDGPHKDEATGTQLAFKNVLVQYTETLDYGDGYKYMTLNDATRDGWFFTNGKGIHVTWTKDSDYGATRYYDDFGNEIVLNTGKTMICVVADEDTFSFK